MKGYTDYPFTLLGDVANKEAPIREIEILSYDGDKYASIIVEGLRTSIKRGYCYANAERLPKASAIPQKYWKAITI